MKRLRRILLVLVVLVIIAGVVLWRMSRMPPAWYAPPDGNDPNVAERADRVEYALLEQFHRIRPADETWGVRVSEDQVNAWFSARLEKWMARDADAPWPAQLGTPQIKLESGSVDVALPILEDSARRTVVARFQPVFINGRLHLDLVSVALGRIALPGEPLANLLKLLSSAAPDSLAHPKLREACEWLERDRTIDPVIELSDGRHVRLNQLRIRQGQLEFTAQTIAETPKADR